MDARKMAANFIDRYGADRFRWLLAALADGASGEGIASELQVSRERVRQWKNAFGTVITLYRIHPEIEDLPRGHRL